MATQDYYQTLGVKKDASPDAIKKAYRKLAVKYHPDKNPGDKQAEERFKEINEAYAVLSDPEKKAQYDQFGSTGFHQRYSQEDIFRGFDVGDMFKESGFSTEDIFARIFGGGFGGRGGFGAQFGGGFGGMPRRGEDLSMELPVTFQEAYSGADKRVAFMRGGRREELTVKIPAGVDTGERLRVQGKGGEASGGTPGDLYLTMKVGGHPDFSREGDDIVVDRLIAFSAAALGGSLDVPTLEGAKRIRIPAGIQTGTKIRLAGLGFPKRGGKGRGDLFVRIGIQVPRHLSQEQKDLLEKLVAAGL